MANPTKKFRLYEASVQDPQEDLGFTESLFVQTRSRYPFHLREDFSGTGLFSKTWVESHPRRTAVAVDLDPEPHRYGRATHRAPLPPAARARLHYVRGDVRDAPRAPGGGPRPDLVIAYNFSFFVFQARAELKAYFASVARSLAPRGAFILELSGGPGMIERMRERKRVRRRGLDFTYTWDQKSYDPIQSRGQYAIHFQEHGKNGPGRLWKDAFTYDWRIWTIPELREILAEAGFARSVVFWETEHRGEGTGEFLALDQGDNAYSWIAYVIGLN